MKRGGGGVWTGCLYLSLTKKCATSVKFTERERKEMAAGFPTGIKRRERVVSDFKHGRERDPDLHREAVREEDSRL